ncbi:MULTISPECIES: FG-GAP repeat domain-containing protein [Leisingera]|uniref:FG-GAP repeat domain-containing protein n=1 Tax=Leisingera TaxID=191028 RepID=UPI001CF87EFC|nr:MULTISPECIES: VCBS repeat-containing protein [Leisingera]MCB4455256.1 VCBS repeat-containing protein [Leisingera sp. McT4-56]
MRARPGSARRAWWAVCLWAGVLSAAEACRLPPGGSGASNGSYTVASGCKGSQFEICPGQNVSAAWYSGETSRYAHGVLGDAIEYTRLTVYSSAAGADSCGTKSVSLDIRHVFEDTAPRLVDLDGDQSAEIITVRSHAAKGAQLAIYTDRGAPDLQLVATTPYIGRKNRWLAPIGAADLDGDGHVEIAYIDRPHLAKTLRIWRFRDGVLREVASKPGLTNHRIGEEFITSGIRDCGEGPELVTASGDWHRIIISRLQDGEIATKDIGAFKPGTGLTEALACR